jgi:transcriptional regulator with XRE-family HTH domain
MPEDPKPVPPIRRRQLAYRLTELRDEARMTQDDAVRLTGLSRSTISKIENAEQAILEKNVRLLAGAYGVTSPELDMLLRMARESNQRGLLVAHADVAADFARDYIKLESYATPDSFRFPSTFAPSGWFRSRTPPRRSCCGQSTCAPNGSDDWSSPARRVSG